MPPGHDARSNFAYDHPDRIGWTKRSPKGPSPPGGGDGKLAYYDVARNVFVVPGLWAYRHKRQAAAESGK
jgi:hypothetical protein